MTRIIQFVTIMILVAFSGASASDIMPVATIESLVERSYWAIDRIEDNHIKLRKLLEVAPRTAKINEQLEALRKSSREARSELDKFIAKIEVGKSIFSYRGLIGLGRIRYVSSKESEKSLLGTYYLQFLVGFSDTDSGGSEPRHYQVHFDGSGLILNHRILPRMTE